MDSLRPLYTRNVQWGVLDELLYGKAGMEEKIEWFFQSTIHKLEAQVIKGTRDNLAGFQGRRGEHGIEIGDVKVPSSMLDEESEELKHSTSNHSWWTGARRFSFHIFLGLP